MWSNGVVFHFWVVIKCTIYMHKYILIHDVIIDIKSWHIFDLGATPEGFLEPLDILYWQFSQIRFSPMVPFLFLVRSSWMNYLPLFHSLAFPEPHFALGRGEKSQLIFFLSLRMGAVIFYNIFQAVILIFRSNLLSLTWFLSLRLNHHFYIGDNTAAGGLHKGLRNSQIGRKAKLTLDQLVYTK